VAVFRCLCIFLIVYNISVVVLHFSVVVCSFSLLVSPCGRLASPCHSVCLLIVFASPCGCPQHISAKNQQHPPVCVDAPPRHTHTRSRHRRVAHSVNRLLRRPHPSDGRSIVVTSVSFFPPASAVAMAMNRRYLASRVRV